MKKCQFCGASILQGNVCIKCFEEVAAEHRACSEDKGHTFEAWINGSKRCTRCGCVQKVPNI